MVLGVSIALKAMNGVGLRTGSNRVTAVAVRENGMDKYIKVLGVMHTVLKTFQESLNPWIAVPESNLHHLSTLFSGVEQRMGQMQQMLHVVGDEIEAVFQVFTSGLHCYDWFKLRELREIGTNGGPHLMSDNAVRS